MYIYIYIFIYIISLFIYIYIDMKLCLLYSRNADFKEIVFLLQALVHAPGFCDQIGFRGHISLASQGQCMCCIKSIPISYHKFMFYWKTI